MRLTAAFLVLFPAAAPAFAAFEDSGFSPRALSMGGAFTAVSEDAACFAFNPGCLGTIRRAQTAFGFLRQFHIPAGETDQDQINLAGVFPVNQEIIRGTAGLSWQYNRRHGESLDRAVSFSYASRGLSEFNDGSLELGGSVKILQRSLEGGAGAALKPGFDAGLFYRFWEKYSLGLSILNFNGPRLDGPRGADRIPATLKLGVAETVRGFTLALDMTKREPSGGYGPTTNLGAGLEHWWASARHGSLAARTGLSLGNGAKLWNWGAGWRILGGQVDYAMTVPLSGRTRLGHAVALLFRFGQSNPESEYERVLSDEVSRRKELTESLQAGEIKQWKLAEELNVLREEISALQKRLLGKTASESEAREKIKDLTERQRQAAEKFQKIQAETQRLKERTKAVIFAEDWAAYGKLKSDGAPESVLTEQIRRMLREYKDAGVDLSEANQELLRLLRSQ